MIRDRGDGALHLQLRRWPAMPARFSIVRQKPFRRGMNTAVSISLTIEEMRAVRRAIDDAEARIAAEPHRPDYDLVTIISMGMAA